MSEESVVMSEPVSDAVARAHDEIVRLCKPGERWRMSIPATPYRDSDLILQDAIDALSARLAAVEALAARWERREGPTASDDMYADLLRAALHPEPTP